MKHHVYFGDARRMSEIADASVQLIVTSPPYWQLKDYGVREQIGFHDTYGEYVAKLNEVWAESHRVLSDGCRLCINVGDQFARAAHYGRYKVMPLHADIIAGCEACGFDYMGAIVWQKPTTMNTTGGATVMGSFPHPRNGIIKIDYEYILIFKKLGKAPAASAAQKAESTLTTAEWNEYFSGHWNFAGERQGDGHLAMFPIELPHRLIRMFSFVGETVLDPFLGSGTTLRAAMELGRGGLGYEINPAFEEAIKTRVADAGKVLFHKCRRRARKSTLASDGAPTLERKVDPKTCRYDSIIAMDDFDKPKRRKPRGVRLTKKDES